MTKDHDIPGRAKTAALARRDTGAALAPDDAAELERGIPHAVRLMTRSIRVSLSCSIFLAMVASAGCSDHDAGQETGSTSAASDASSTEHVTTGGPDDSSTGDGTSGSESTGDVPAVICPKTHDGVTSDGHPVVVCDELFADAPHVRPPADSGSTVHAATDGQSIFIRGEDPRVLATEELAVMGLDIEGTVELRRYGYAIYRVTLDEADRVTASVPAILVPDAAFFGFLVERSAEGVISRHAPDPDNPAFEYEVEPTLPVRVRFTTVAAGDADPAIEPVIKETLAVVVENAAAPVLASTGQCLPALTAVGAENPLDGADLSTLSAERVPSMHGPGDNEFVLGGAATLNHMTAGWIVLPHQLLLEDATIAFPEADFAPHGNPLSMPRLRITVVDGGGGGCTP